MSGGSIAAGYLGLVWRDLHFVNGRAQSLEPFVAGMRTMAGETVDVGAVISGIFLPGDISDRVAAAYDEVLFKEAKIGGIARRLRRRGAAFRN